MTLKGKHIYFLSVVLAKVHFPPFLKHTLPISITWNKKTRLLTP